MSSTFTGAAAPLPRYGSPTTLVPNSGIQFLDFAFDLARLPRLSCTFWEEPLAGQEGPDGRPMVALRRLEEDAEGQLVFFDDDKGALRSAPEEESYRVAAAKALEAFGGEWLPMPLLQVAERDREGRLSYHPGPTAWARVRIVPLPAPPANGDGGAPAPAGPTHRVVIALDTRLDQPLTADDLAAGKPYASPTNADAETGALFRFVPRHADNAWFLNLPWVAQWLYEAYRDQKQALKPGRPLSDDDFPYACEYWALYTTLLELLEAAIEVPELKLVDIDSATAVKPVEVDLVLDVGNSRTCGLLFENIDQTFSMRNAYVLELRDLTRPEQVHQEPFESRIEFARASFGREHIRTGRPDLFVWPSLVRVGAEARRLASELTGTEGATGLSSPKRYLWDKRAARQPWRQNAAEAPSWHDDAGIEGPMTALITEDGEVISTMKTQAGDPPAVSAVLPLFSRSSLYTFMLVEILSQALMMINAPGPRSRRQQADLPRRLKRLILTLPPATPLAEQRILKTRIEGALKLIWELNGWDLSASELHRPPQVLVDWDEASCTQLVYLYTEITQKLQSTARDFFQIMGREREKRGKGPSLRVASIDVGGGTTDLMITTYALEGERAIVPHQEFREGFRVAGDDVLQSVIEQQVVPAIRTELQRCGAAEAEDAMARLFAADPAGMPEPQRLARAVFVSQVLVPIGLALIADYEQSEENPTPTSRRFGDCFPPGKLPAAEVRRYLEAEAAILCSEPFSLENVEFVMAPERMTKTVEATLETVLLDLCEVVSAYDCDVVLLSGRPSRLPAIRRFIRRQMPVPPDRVVAMHAYRAGEWYPFGDSRLRVADPKTTAAVGAMLCAVAEGQLEAFSLRTTRMRMRSTARYIGEMEINGEIRKELFSNIDLDSQASPPPCEVAMESAIFIGFRQLPIARWTATPLYYLEFTRPDDIARLARPLKVTLERQDAKRGEDPEVSMEDFKITEAVDAEGTNARRYVNLRLQTLKSEAGYWLDTGVLRLS